MYQRCWSGCNPGFTTCPTVPESPVPVTLPPLIPGPCPPAFPTLTPSFQLVYPLTLSSSPDKFIGDPVSPRPTILTPSNPPSLFPLCGVIRGVIAAEEIVVEALIPGVLVLVGSRWVGSVMGIWMLVVCLRARGAGTPIGSAVLGL